MLEYKELMDNVIKFSSSPWENDYRELLFRELSKQFSVIPLKENSKIPLESGWTKYCTERRTYQKHEFMGRNAGIACGPASNLLVLDVDDVDAFNALLKEKGHPTVDLDTFTVKTGGGGKHYYFSPPNDGNDYGNKNININNNHVFDLRGKGGQVVAPGSCHPVTGMIYEIANYSGIKPAPGWILQYYVTEENVTAKVDSRKVVINGVDVDLLTMDIPEELKVQILYPWNKGGRSEVVMSVICKLLVAGVSEEDIHAIFWKYQIGEKHREHGVSASSILQAEIEKGKVICRDTIENKKQRRVGRKTYGDVLHGNKQLNFLVEDFWPKQQNMILFGTGGCGKSLCTLVIAAEIISPSKEGLFGKFKVNEPGKVIFFQSENSEAAINTRISKNPRLKTVFTEHKDKICFATPEHSEHDDTDIMVSGNIEDKTFFKYVCRQIEEFQPSVVILDALVSFHRRDENDNAGMRSALDKFTEIQDKYNVNILVVHHASGKSSSGGVRIAGRGATAIFDWSRNSVELRQQGKNQQHFLLESHKASDTPGFGAISLVRDENLDYVYSDDSTSNTCGETLKKAKRKSQKINLAVKLLGDLGGKVEKQQLLTDKMYNDENVSTGAAQKLIVNAIKSGMIIEVKGPRNSKSLMLPEFAEARG